jgi:YHS domain-containing protein
MCSDARRADGLAADPVCGMSVAVGRAGELGLTLEHAGTLVAFCGLRCLGAFQADPSAYPLAAVGSHAHAAATAAAALEIDEGMRRWYDACSCCLSDAYPDVKAALDAERTAAAQALAGPGICEVAEATV